MATINLTKGGFERKIDNLRTMRTEWNFLGDKPAVIDFYASWCGPCQTLSPVLDELSEKYAGKIDIYKVNVDKEQELSSIFGIRSVPTLIFIPTQGAPQKTPGALSKPQLIKIFDEYLLKK